MSARSAQLAPFRDKKGFEYLRSSFPLQLDLAVEASESVNRWEEF